MNEALGAVLPYFLILGGFLNFVNVYQNRDSFYENYKVQRVVAVLGRSGTRVFYFFFSCLMMAFGGWAAWTGLFL